MKSIGLLAACLALITYSTTVWADPSPKRGIAHSPNAAPRVVTDFGNGFGFCAYGNRGTTKGAGSSGRGKAYNVGQGDEGINNAFDTFLCTDDGLFMIEWPDEGDPWDADPLPNEG